MDKREKKVSVVVIGEEIISSFTKEKNFVFVSEKLYPLGFSLYLQVVGDDREKIKFALSSAEKFSDFIVCSGGLGSTSDDITRKAASDYFNLPLEENEGAVKFIFERYQRRTGRSDIPDVLRFQGTFPKGAHPIPNYVGSAFGFKVERNGKIFYFLPGVPQEFADMFERSVLPDILSFFPELKRLEEKVFKIFGVTETYVEKTLQEIGIPEGVKVSYLPRFPEVILKVQGEPEILQDFAEKIRSNLSSFIYSEEKDKTLSSVVGELLLKNGQTISVAESLTGGELANMITDTPGSSKYFKGGEIVYTNEAKIKLGVNEETLKNFGAVSHECAKELARSVRERFNSTFGISTTGVAGPDPLEGKPPGLFYIGISSHQGEKSFELRFNIGRKNVKILASFFALKFLLEELKRQ